MGSSALVAGFALAVMSLGWPIAATVAGRLMIRTSYRLTAAIGGLALVIGSLVLVALDPQRGPVWAGTGAFLIGVGMGFCNTTFIVSVQSSVGWSQRGIATSSNMFMRMVGQSLGAALFGAILNLATAQLSDAQGAIDRLMQPTLRNGLGAADIARLTQVIGGALHQVYLVAVLLAVVALLLTLCLPAGWSPGRSARSD
jgi:MFS family permease